MIFLFRNGTIRLTLQLHEGVGVVCRRVEQWVIPGFVEYDMTGSRVWAKDSARKQLVKENEMKVQKIVLVLIMVLGMTIVTQATASIYVDFGPTLDSTGGVQADGYYWNMMTNDHPTGLTLSDMVDETNGSTTVDLVVASGFDTQDINFKYGYEMGSVQSSIVNWNTNATGDGWSVRMDNDNTNGTSDLRLKGLVPYGRYTLEIYGGRWSVTHSQTRTLGATINGRSQSFNSETEHTMIFSNLYANTAGQIDINMWTQPTGTPWGHLNAMKIVTVFIPPKGTVITIK